VLDLGLPDIDGVEVTRMIRAELPFTAIVILTASERDDQLMDALRAGAKGYVLKTSDFQELVSALESVAIGQATLPPEVVGKLLGQLPAEAAIAPVAVAPIKRIPSLRVDLSEREFDVLRLVVTGTRNREIAHQLSLSENTVRSYLTHIMQKLGVENRVQVATEAVRRGLVTLDDIAL
jgi:DNA-binding NarL/FixJ family response regulator